MKTQHRPFRIEGVPPHLVETFASSPPAAACGARPAPDADPIDQALATAQSTFRSPRMTDAVDADANKGTVHWNTAKSIWIGAMTVITVVGGPLFITPGAVVVFAASLIVTLCLGHSLGMHRRLIHRSYDCPLWLERLFVYLGTLAGMAGPFGMIRQHDMRDWAQRAGQVPSLPRASLLPLAGRVLATPLRAKA